MVSIDEYKKMIARTTKPQKYLNQPITTSEGRFDSRGEFRRWIELKTLERVGYISNLKRQVSYPLTEKKSGQRRVFWRVDYIYVQNGVTIAEDFKSSFTAKLTAFRNKAKMFMEKYPDIRVMVSTSHGVEPFK